MPSLFREAHAVKPIVVGGDWRLSIGFGEATIRADSRTPASGALTERNTVSSELPTSGERRADVRGSAGEHS